MFVFNFVIYVTYWEANDENIFYSQQCYLVSLFVG